MVQPNTLVALAMLHPDPADNILRTISQSTYGLGTDTLTKDEEQAMRDFKAAARKCFERLTEQTLKGLHNIAESIFAATEQLALAEQKHEDAMEEIVDFWVAVSKESVGRDRFKESYDMRECKWLGNGKWGWVMVATGREDNREVVLKLSDIKHAMESVKEWKYGMSLGKHATIVEYQQCFLFYDPEQMMKAKLLEGYQSGLLKGTSKRNFPDTFICMVQEFINCGSVQNWMDKSLLHPTGMLVVMQQVADALAYMHGQGVTHNDMKPENILLHHTGKHINVKLGDLGLAEKSENRTADITRYGMTALCMATGERYGSRRFARESIDEFVGDMTTLSQECGVEGKLGSALSELPDLLRQVFNELISMKQVRDYPCLQRWEFLEEGAAAHFALPNAGPIKENGGATRPPSIAVGGATRPPSISVNQQTLRRHSTEDLDRGSRKLENPSTLQPLVSRARSDGLRELLARSRCDEAQEQTEQHSSSASPSRHRRLSGNPDQSGRSRMIDEQDDGRRKSDDTMSKIKLRINTQGSS